jgi:hypothetical protein
MARIAHRLLQASLLTLPMSAMAAPFCVSTQGLPPECIYFDAASCTQRATQMNGNCTINPNEPGGIRLTPSIGHYCLITGGGASLCIYVDQSDCLRDAARQRGGGCILAGRLPESPAPDPFRNMRPPNAGGFDTTAPSGLGPTTAPPADALRNPGR